MRRVRLVPVVLLLARAALAGGGPESTFVVVNAESPVSRRIANEYVALRDIPASHVVYLEDVPRPDVVDLDVFLEKIWKPIDEQMNAHGVADRIELITYSADLPWAVAFRPEPSQEPSRASLTGATYLVRAIEAGEPFWDLRFNRYFGVEFVGEWKARMKPARALAPEEGYYLSTQLGHAGRYGNSVPEILAYLRASAGVDGTFPGGTVYICRSSDVRSRTREPFFPWLVEELETRGRKVEQLDCVLPEGRSDVIGAVVGKGQFRWADSKSRILPGAICEHLTSFGAGFHTPRQTKLTEFLRHGAAGASGTVAEPRAIHQKFPNPLVHVFYADGCSLAESFFQSVWSPYQLLIVGDGLARPFAKPVRVHGMAPYLPWRGTVPLIARASGAAVELWVDGEYVAGGEPGRPVPFDTTRVEDGHHDVRLVVVEGSAVATRSYIELAAIVDNHGHEVHVETRPRGTVPWGQEGKVRLKASRAAELQLWQGDRLVARSAGGDLTFDTRAVGPGPVRLLPRVRFEDGTAWRGAPLEFDVDATSPVLSGASQLPAPSKTGARGTVVDTDGTAHPVVITHLGDTQSGRGLGRQLGSIAARRASLNGWLRIAQHGFYQLRVSGSGRLALDVSGARFEETLERPLHLPLLLDAGWHPFSLEFEPQGPPLLDLMLGGDQVFAPLELRHFSFPAIARSPTAPSQFGSLLDGRREDEGVTVDEAGVVLRWKRAAEDLAALTIFPAESPDAFPLEWSVETATGAGPFEPVADLHPVVAHSPSEARAAPLFVELSFQPVTADRLRIAPARPALVAEVEVLGARPSP